MKRLPALLAVFTFLVGMIPAASAQTGPFPDIYPSHINVDAIDYLKDASIIEGYPDGQYKPSLEINRAEFSKIVVGAVVDDPQGANCFPDVKEEWFARFVCEGKERGILEGYPDGTFKPAENINFSEAAKIIANAYGEDAQDLEGERWFQEYVDALAEEKAIPFSIEFFDENITRDEMAEMIYRLRADVKNKATRSYEEINADQFITVDSCAALSERFEANNRYFTGFGGGIEVLEEGAVRSEQDGAVPPAEPQAEQTSGDEGEANDAVAPGGAGSDDYSTTNIQVEGVDEADIIKNDGKYIYIIKNGTIRIVNAYPAEDMEELVSITLGEEDEDFWPSEMYVDGDTLVAIGSIYKYQILEDDTATSTSELSIYPPHNYQNRTRVYVLDITDRSKPTIQRTVEFDGYYGTSRKVGDTLYTVVNQYANFPYYYYDQPAEFDPDTIVPLMRDSAVGEDELIAPCNEIRIFPKDRGNNFLITAAIPLTDTGAEVDRNVLVGNSETVYASRQNMYVTATDWSGGWKRDSWDTAIYRFALDENSIDYASRGNVPGTVLNQFSMDENGNYFRIATTDNDFGGDSTNNLYVLDLNLNRVGALENIAPGESIYSVRFVGNKAYMVTFERIDPLFVIGLEDPANPEILGELKIPGFSNYLHPFDENHLIGFGKEVDPGDTNLSGEEFTLWNQVQGLKIGLFDVSDVNNPKELFTEVIGDQGTDSQLLYNHKALLFDKEKELLAFPISVYEYQDVNSCQDYTYSSCPSDCRQICVPSSCTFENGITICTTDCDGANSCVQQEFQYGQKVFEGAYVYNISTEDGFELKGTINHHNEDDLLDLSETGYVNYQKAIERLVYIGENLYSISQWGVKANLLDDLTELDFIELAGNSEWNYWEEPMPL